MMIRQILLNFQKTKKQKTSPWVKIMHDKFLGEKIIFSKGYRPKLYTKVNKLDV